MRARDLIRRTALAGSLGALLLAALGPGARAQDEDAAAAPPESFAGDASSSVLDVAVLTPALVPIPGLFDMSFVEGRSRFESATQEGRASLLYPGAGLVTGPDLLCGTFIAPQLPPEADPIFGPILEACQAYEFPLSVQVDALHPDAQTDAAAVLGASGDPAAFKAVGARAHVSDDGASTEAQLGDLRVLGVPALGSLDPLLRLVGLPPLGDALLRVEGMTATTDQRIADGKLVVESVATATGVQVAGLLRIGSIVSRSTITAGPTGDPEVATGIEVEGVTVAGLPAQITEDGLVLGSPSAPSGPLVQALTRNVGALLDDLGLRTEVLPSEQGQEHGVAFASTGGLVIELAVPIEGLPPLSVPALGDVDLNGAYGVRLQLGTTGVRGFATGDEPLVPEEVGGTGGDVALPPFVGGDAPSFPDTGDDGGLRAVTTEPDAGTAPERTSVLADVLADRMALIYLSFTLGAIALALAPRLTVPARFPGAGS